MLLSPDLFLEGIDCPTSALIEIQTIRGLPEEVLH
jgi:hypothetical protein